METRERSLELLRKFFEETPRSEIEAILAKYDRLEFEGSNFSSYLADFQDSFEFEGENNFKEPMEVGVSRESQSQDSLPGKIGIIPPPPRIGKFVPQHLFSRVFGGKSESIALR